MSLRVKKNLNFKRIHGINISHVTPNNVFDRSEKKAAQVQAWIHGGAGVRRTLTIVARVGQ